MRDDEPAEQQQAREGKSAKDVHGVIEPFGGQHPRVGGLQLRVAPMPKSVRERSRRLAPTGDGSGATARRASRYLRARMVIVVLLWLLGHDVFFVAMRGGPRPRRRCRPNRRPASA